MRLIAPVRAAGSLRASMHSRVARSRSSSGYLRGAAMIGILPGLRCLHQTRGSSVGQTGFGLAPVAAGADSGGAGGLGDQAFDAGALGVSLLPLVGLLLGALAL